jgi:hypothetical protein
MQINNKGFVWLPVLLVILGVLIVSGGTYWYVHSQHQASQVSINQQTSGNSQDASDIVAISPAAGEVLQAGSEYVIHWTGWQESPTRPVDGTDPYISIGLNPAATPHLDTEGYPNTAITTGPGGSEAIRSIGTYNWNIPSTLTPGQYVLSFCEFVEADCRSVSYSEAFTVVSPTVQTQPVSVPGMSEYTDSNFGFSFWYPSGWTVQPQAVSNANAYSYYSSGTIQKELLVSNPDTSLKHQNILVEEYNSPQGGVTIPVQQVSCACGPTDATTYYFEATDHAWFVVDYDSNSDSNLTMATDYADVSQNTMGGLHMLHYYWGGTLTSGVPVVIPLSAQNFVIVDGTGDDWAGPPNPILLANTITATDPSVATPVSAAQQVQVIQAEQQAYQPAPYINSADVQDDPDGLVLWVFGTEFTASSTVSVDNNGHTMILSQTQGDTSNNMEISVVLPPNTCTQANEDCQDGSISVQILNGNTTSNIFKLTDTHG